MKLKLIIIFIFVTLLLKAQTKTVGFHDFYIGIKPTFTQMLVTKDNFQSIFKITNSYTPAFGLGITIGSEYYINPKWAFRAGFNYSNNRFIRKEEGWLFGSDVDLATGTAKTSSNIKSYNDLRYVDVPITVIHYLNKNRKIFVGAGIGMNVLVQKKSYDKIFYGNGEIQELNIYKSQEVKISNYNVELLGGYKLKLSNHTSLLLQPFINLKLKQETLDIYASKGLQISYGALFLLNFDNFR